jgi:hypothetical protein
VIFIDEDDTAIAFFDAVVGKGNHLFRLSGAFLADNQLDHCESPTLRLFCARRNPINPLGTSLTKRLHSAHLILAFAFIIHQRRGVFNTAPKIPAKNISGRVRVPCDHGPGSKNALRFERAGCTMEA